MEKKEMTKVCAIAHQIYSTWQKEGTDGLECFFEQKLKIPTKQAKELALKYIPRPPKEVNSNQKSSSQIFKELGLQFSSIRSKDKNGIWPKNILAWWIIKNIYGEVFDFQIRGKHKRKENKIKFPSYPCNEECEMVPLGLVALEAVNFEGIPTHMVKKSLKIIKRLGKKIGQDLTKVLFESRIIFPPASEIDLLCDTIEKGLTGEKIILTGEFYPDYAYKKVSKENDICVTPYCYTFENVGDGVGLVAQQIAGMLPVLIKFFKKYHIQYDIKLAIGDFEADNPALLQRMKIGREDFIGKCECSLARFKEIFPDTSLNLFLFQEEWAKQRWGKYIEEAHTRLSKGDFGELKSKIGKNPQGVVEFILRTSKEFYCNLCAKELTQREVHKMVLRQGAEHATVARIFSEDINQPIIQLAGDYPKMQMFNKMYAEHTTLCAQRIF